MTLTSNCNFFDSFIYFINSRVEGDGIVNIPFTSVSKETLNNLLEQFNAPDTNNEIIGETKL